MGQYASKQIKATMSLVNGRALMAARVLAGMTQQQLASAHGAPTLQAMVSALATSCASALASSIVSAFAARATCG